MASSGPHGGEHGACTADAFCCSGFWDGARGAQALTPCPDICPTGSNCCTAKESKGTDKFQGRTVDLDHDLEDKDFVARSPVALCDPVTVSSPLLTIPALDLDEHLKAYAIKEAKGEPKHVKALGIELLVPNLLLVTSVDTSKPDRLLVPSTKSIIVPLSDTTYNIDHYKCYKAKTTKGTPKFVGAFFLGQDQFEPAKDYDLKKLTRVCLPVDKNGEGIINPDWNLLCFSAKPAKLFVP